jgi:major vault protein
MIMVPPRHYCIIENPVVRDHDQKVIRDKNGQVRLRHSDQEIRFESPDPFPLYPGESLVGKVTPLQVVAPNTAIKLRAIRDYKDFKAGDEWLFKGPGTYHPSVEVQVVEIVKAIIIKPNQAVRLKARKDFVDSEGKHRKAGEEWLIRLEGAYLPDVHEEVRETISAYVLTEKKALHLTAITTFTDIFKVLRKAGEQWLVTLQDAETHIPDVYERVIGEVPITTLTSRQYCVVVDPVDDQGRNQLGKRELRKGEGSFFLRPGERLENGIQNVHVLEDDEALLLSAREVFEDGKSARQPGERWMIRGPCDYVPNIYVILSKNAELFLSTKTKVFTSVILKPVK